MMDVPIYFLFSNEDLSRLGSFKDTNNTQGASNPKNISTSVNEVEFRGNKDLNRLKRTTSLISLNEGFSDGSKNKNQLNSNDYNIIEKELMISIGDEIDKKSEMTSFRRNSEASIYYHKLSGVSEEKRLSLLKRVNLNFDANAGSKKSSTESRKRGLADALFAKGKENITNTLIDMGNGADRSQVFKRVSSESSGKHSNRNLKQSKTAYEKQLYFSSKYYRSDIMQSDDDNDINQNRKETFVKKNATRDKSKRPINRKNLAIKKINDSQIIPQELDEFLSRSPIQKLPVKIKPKKIRRESEKRQSKKGFLGLVSRKLLGLEKQKRSINVENEVLTTRESSFLGYFGDGNTQAISKLTGIPEQIIIEKKRYSKKKILPKNLPQHDDSFSSGDDSIVSRKSKKSLDRLSKLVSIKSGAITSPRFSWYIDDHISINSGLQKTNEPSPRISKIDSIDLQLRKNDISNSESSIISSSSRLDINNKISSNNKKKIPGNGSKVPKSDLRKSAISNFSKKNAELGAIDYSTSINPSSLKERTLNSEMESITPDKHFMYKERNVKYRQSQSNYSGTIAFKKGIEYLLENRSNKDAHTSYFINYNRHFSFTLYEKNKRISYLPNFNSKRYSLGSAIDKNDEIFRHDYVSYTKNLLSGRNAPSTDPNFLSTKKSHEVKLGSQKKSHFKNFNDEKSKYSEKISCNPDDVSSLASNDSIMSKNASLLAMVEKVLEDPTFSCTKNLQGNVPRNTVRINMNSKRSYMDESFSSVNSRGSIKQTGKEIEISTTNSSVENLSSYGDSDHLDPQQAQLKSGVLNNYGIEKKPKIKIANSTKYEDTSGTDESELYARGSYNYKFSQNLKPVEKSISKTDPVLLDGIFSMLDSKSGTLGDESIVNSSYIPDNKQKFSNHRANDHSSNLSGDSDSDLSKKNTPITKFGDDNVEEIGSETYFSSSDSLQNEKSDTDKNLESDANIKFSDNPDPRIKITAKNTSSNGDCYVENGTTSASNINGTFVKSGNQIYEQYDDYLITLRENGANLDESSDSIYYKIDRKMQEEFYRNQEQYKALNVALNIQDMLNFNDLIYKLDLANDEQNIKLVNQKLKLLVSLYANEMYIYEISSQKSTQIEEAHMYKIRSYNSSKQRKFAGHEKEDKEMQYRNQTTSPKPKRSKNSQMMSQGGEVSEQDEFHDDDESYFSNTSQKNNVDYESNTESNSSESLQSMHVYSNQDQNKDIKIIESDFSSNEIINLDLLKACFLSAKIFLVNKIETEFVQFYRSGMYNNINDFVIREASEFISIDNALESYNQNLAFKIVSSFDVQYSSIFSYSIKNNDGEYDSREMVEYTSGSQNQLVPESSGDENCNRIKKGVESEYFPDDHSILQFVGVKKPVIRILTPPFIETSPQQSSFYKELGSRSPSSVQHQSYRAPEYFLNSEVNPYHDLAGSDYSIPVKKPGSMNVKQVKFKSTNFITVYEYNVYTESENSDYSDYSSISSEEFLLSTDESDYDEDFVYENDEDYSESYEESESDHESGSETYVFEQEDSEYEQIDLDNKPPTSIIIPKQAEYNTIGPDRSYNDSEGFYEAESNSERSSGIFEYGTSRKSDNYNKTIMLNSDNINIQITKPKMVLISEDNLISPGSSEETEKFITEGQNSQLNDNTYPSMKAEVYGGNVSSQDKISGGYSNISTTDSSLSQKEEEPINIQAGALDQSDILPQTEEQELESSISENNESDADSDNIDEKGLSSEENDTSNVPQTNDLSSYKLVRINSTSSHKLKNRSISNMSGSKRNFSNHNLKNESKLSIRRASKEEFDEYYSDFSSSDDDFISSRATINRYNLSNYQIFEQNSVGPADEKLQVSALENRKNNPDIASRLLDDFEMQIFELKESLARS
ncbi:hypothetical protein AYI70_g5863 [Smittium culicis]|uniref:Uncharacterized protein n=1 Tax=Smittium culicis TaxID=133412 RepID=A0A1R1XSM2_9FUNG|nr:hypothetical protein AYI70_g5863 [Smittium culicis]